MGSKLDRTDKHDGGTRLERVILFILGAGFGAVIGFWIVITAQTPVIFFSGITLAALTVGVVSAKFGMRFWERVRHIGWWVH